MSGATTSGTETFAARAVRNDVAPAHFREACDLTLSTIGLGTYLGATDDATDDAYAEAILEAVGMGCNVLDTASTYRCQRSERVIGRALERLAEAGVDRDELVLATKGGYVAFDGAPPGEPESWIEEHYIARLALRTGRPRARQPRDHAVFSRRSARPEPLQSRGFEDRYLLPSQPRSPARGCATEMRFATSSGALSSF